MKKNIHTASDFTVEKKNEQLNTIYHFFYGWDADGAPIENYPNNEVKVKVKKNDSTK